MLLPRIASLLAVVALSTACSVTAPEGDAGPKPDPKEEGPPPLADCEDHSDCAGGEACRDGKCRTVCEANEDCSGYYGRCETDLGYCVACVTDAHCDDDERCSEGLCVFHCRADGHCDEGEACDEDTGECFERQCERNADCSGGYVCTDGRCVSIDPVICEAGSVRCDDGAVVSCNGDGTRETRTACEEDERCVEDGDLAACAVVVCTPNELGCADDGAAYVCDGTGTRRTDLPCNQNQYCEAGVCRNQVCEPSTVSCEGNSLVICDARGAQAESVSCDATPACDDEAFGCACVDDACEPRVCQPDSAQCVGNGFRRCNADGTAYEAPVSCTGDDVCAGGACVPPTCDAGETRCSGDMLLTCNAGGTGWNETSCAASGEACVVDGDEASCGERVCEPLSAVCSANGRAVITCNGIGTAATTTPCDDDEYCQGGVCRAQVCEPGERSCAGPASTQVCNANGSALTVTPCDDDETCVDGACQTASCTPDCSGRQCGLDPVCGTSCGTCDGTCDDGQCLPASSDGGVPDDGGTAVACVHSGQCESDEYCDWVLFFGGTCFEGCADNNDCPGGMKCNGGGACVLSITPLANRGESCTKNSDCVAGLSCAGVLTQTCQEQCIAAGVPGNVRSCSGDPDCCPRTNAASCVDDFLVGLSATCKD